MLWGGVTLLAVAAGLFAGIWLPAVLLGIQGAMILTAILAAWLKFGRADLPALTLLAVPFYVLWKVPLYVAYAIRPQTKWIRTERDAISKP
jgi:hypothetical protein